MKTILALLTALLVVSSSQAAPELPIDKALKIANSYLKENGRTDVWVSAIELEKTSATTGHVWAVKWNTPVVLDDTKRETGLEVAMDGTIARYTEKVANANTPAVAGVPADRTELSNHRTRTKRPSILDLKH
jgi:hypothetical protein